MNDLVTEIIANIAAVIVLFLFIYWFFKYLKSDTYKQLEKVKKERDQLLLLNEYLVEGFKNEKD